MAGTLPTYTLLIAATVDGSAIQNVRIYVRNERTNETINGDTNSDGETLLDAANLTSGVSTTDSLTIFTIYQNYEGSTTHTVTTGGADISLVLSTVPASDSLRYFTVQDYYDYVGYASTDSDIINSVDIVKVGTDIEKEIDEITGRRYDDSNTVTDEYHDMKNKYQRDFFMFKTPIQSVTSFSVNDASQGSEQSWRDIIVTNSWPIDTDNNTGRIRITDSADFPEVGTKQVKVTYTYGVTSVPRDIRRLAVMMTAKHFMMTAAMRSDASGREYTPQLGFVDAEIKRILGRNTLWNIRNT